MNKPDLKEIKSRQEAMPGDWVRVGMSTCGIAAGAERIFNYLTSEVEKNQLNLRVRKCGCLGACYAEPLVEVNLEGMPRIIYGNVDEKTAERIVKEHIISGRVLDSGVYELTASKI